MSIPTGADRIEETPEETTLPTGRAHPEHVKWSVRYLELADKAFRGQDPSASSNSD